jgi:hypothetical protein
VVSHPFALGLETIAPLLLRSNEMRTAWLLCAALVATAGCSGEGADGWAATGDRSAFPSPLTVGEATAIRLDGTYLYWVTTDGFLYHTPRAGGEVGRVRLPATAEFLSVHNDVYVGWTDGSGSAAIEDIDPSSGTVNALIQQPGALLALESGQRGYSYAVAAPGGIRVQACRDGACTDLIDIPSAFIGLANDFPTRTFYVLTADGLRTCTLDAGCSALAAPTPTGTMFVDALPGTYFLLDSKGQPFGRDGSPLGTAAAPGPTDWEVVDGNGYVATWSNETQLAQCTLGPGATTSLLSVACASFDTDSTGRPIFCLQGSSTVQVLP